MRNSYRHDSCRKCSLFIFQLHTTHVPPSCDCIRVEVLGNPSELVLASGVMSSHDGLLMVLPQGE